MNVLAKTIAPQVLIASLPFWYHDVRIEWLGMTFSDRISMRWLDAGILGALAVCCLVFLRQTRVPGNHVLVRVFRVAMLSSLALTLSLAAAVLLAFALVPCVPAHFPPATPGTWIWLALDYAAPVAAVATTVSMVVSLLYVSTRSARAEPSAPGGPPSVS